MVWYIVIIMFDHYQVPLFKHDLKSIIRLKAAAETVVFLFSVNCPSKRTTIKLLMKRVASLGGRFRESEDKGDES